MKTTHIAGKERGYDKAKTTKGRKRHLIVDTLAMVLAVVVHSAGLQDQEGAPLVLQELREAFRRLKVIFADSGNVRSGLPEFVRKTLGIVLTIVKRPRTPSRQPKRWIVERTFGWINEFRRHSKDYERNAETSEALIQISMILVMVKRLARS